MRLEKHNGRKSWFCQWYIQSGRNGNDVHIWSWPERWPNTWIKCDDINEPYLCVKS